MKKRLIYLLVFFVLILFVISACEQYVGANINKNLNENFGLNKEVTNKEGVQIINSNQKHVDLNNVPLKEDVQVLDELVVPIPSEENLERYGIIVENNGPRRDNPTVISECGSVINESGSYILENNLNCSDNEFLRRNIPAIIVTTGNVNLDCQGNEIIGPFGEEIPQDSPIHGIYQYRYLWSLSNLSVINCVISKFNWGVTGGGYLGTAVIMGVYSSVAENNNFGFYFPYHTVALGNIASNNRYHGFYIYSSLVYTNTANNNGQYGFIVVGSLNNNFRNTANNNHICGFYTIPESEKNFIYDNIANNNHICGFRLEGMNHSIFRNTANNNGQYGFNIATSRSTIYGNTADNNSYGLSFSGEYNNIYKNKAKGNDVGIILRGFGEGFSNIYNNIAKNNEDGFYMSAYSIIFSNNEARENNRFGVLLFQLWRENNFSSNNICFNGLKDIACSAVDLNYHRGNNFDRNKYSSSANIGGCDDFIIQIPPRGLNCSSNKGVQPARRLERD